MRFAERTSGNQRPVEIDASILAEGDPLGFLVSEGAAESITDAAYRYAVVNGRAGNEIRAGLTFAFKVEGDKTPAKPGVTFGNWGLSR